jgi:hypothetical protein
MHSISMAIRSLSHQSMIYRGVGFAPRANIGMGMGVRRSVLGGGAGRQMTTTQAQSDAMMSHAIRALQGIGMQLGSNGSGGMGNARAQGHVQGAIHELNVALSIR